MHASRCASAVVGGAVAAMLLASPVSAQSGGMPFTIVAGINIAGVTDVAGAGDKTGVLVGVGTSFALTKDMVLAPEALFQMNGASYGAASTSVNYLSFPILFRYSFPASGESGMRPYVSAGPNVALRLSCSISGGGPGATCATAFGKDPKSIDFGLTFGGGLEFKAGTNTFGVGLRYQIGLTDVVDGAKGKNKAIQIIGTFKIK